MYINIKDLSMK